MRLVKHTNCFNDVFEKKKLHHYLQELTMNCVNTQASSACNDCVELETVRHQVERLQSEQKRLNEDHDRTLAEQNGHFENLLLTHRKKISMIYTKDIDVSL